MAFPLSTLGIPIDKVRGLSWLTGIGDARYLKLDQTTPQVTIGEFQFPQVYLKGTTNIPLSPTQLYANINYLNPFPIGVTINEIQDASGAFSCGGISTNVYVWGINSSIGDKAEWSSTPLVQPFTDSNTVYSVGDPYFSGVSEYYNTYTVGDPTDNGSYIDTNAGNFINQQLDAVVWGYRTIGGVFYLNSGNPTGISISDYNSVTFQGKFQWNSASDATGYILQVTPDGGSNYYYLDVGATTAYDVADNTFSGWNYGGYSPSGTSSVDWGGSYMTNNYYDFYVWSYYDSPLGRVFSQSASVYGGLNFYTDYRGALIAYSAGTNETGIMLMRTPDYGSTWEYKDMGSSGSFGGYIIDDGSGWTSGQATVTPISIPSKFFIDSYWSSSDYTNFLVAYSDPWNSSSAWRYAYVTGTTTARLEDGSLTWDALANDSTLETWVNAHLAAEPSGTETADGVTRHIYIYGRTVYAGVTAYSPTPLDLTYSIDNSGKKFYLDAGWTHPSPQPTGYKVKYGTNYAITTGTSYSTAGATWGSDATVTPTSYYSDARIYSPFWTLSESGYTFIGTGNLSGTLTDATTATRSGLNLFTGIARFTGTVTQAVQGFQRMDMGIDVTPRVVFEDAGTVWQIDNAGGTFRWFLPGAVKFQMTSTQISALVTMATTGLTGTTCSMTGAIGTSNLNVTNAYTNHLTQPSIHVNNSSSSGQNVFWNTINSSRLSVWRTDYLGGVSWAAGLGAASHGTKSGYHNFFTGGDYGSGATSKLGINLRSSYYSDGGATKCAQGSVGLLMGTAENPYTEFDVMHKLFMDTTKSALLFSPTALASRAAAEALMTANFNVVGTGYFSTTLTAGTYIYGSLGAVGTPTYSFTGDPNTGMYSTGADALAFATAGATRMTFGATGEIAVGTTPTAGIPFRIIKSTTQLAAAQTNVYVDGVHTLNANNAFQLRGIYSGPSVNQAGFNATTATSGGGAIPSFYALPQATGASGTVTNVTGYFASPRNTGAGTVSNIIGFLAGPNLNTGGGVITNNYGFYTLDHTTATNNYGFYSTMTAGVGKWAFYSGGTAQNYFAGSVGIGVTVPATKLHVLATTEQLRLGYDASNYLSFTVGSTNAVTLANAVAADININCGTDKTVVLAESVWCDIDFPILIRTTGTGIPTLTTFNGNLTMPQWAVNDFNMCESQEFIHEWKEGTTCYWHIHLNTNGLDADNRYVKFELEYAYSVAGVWTFPAVVTTADILIPANTADKTQIIMSIANFTPTNTKIGDHAVARLKRVTATGTAPTNNPWIPMLQMHIEKDTIGSRQMTAK